MSRKTVVKRDIPADLETPVSAFLKLRAAGARFLLESVENGERLGRFSFIGVGSAARVTVGAKALEVDGVGGKRSVAYGEGGALGALRDLLRAQELPAEAGAPSLLGGLVGYLSYDFVRNLEKVPATLPDRLGLPDGVFLLTDALVMFDHIRRRMTLVALADDVAAGEKRLDAIVERLRGALPALPKSEKTTRPLESDTTREQYQASVEAAKEHIRAGNAYQVVLSQRWSGAIGVAPFQVYRALRILNPSPYMFYFDFDDFQLVGSSPEVMTQVKGRRCTVRPIAGTRRRGATREEDVALEAELLADEKERAEHIMLVDLGRNDIGRVARFGTVELSDVMAIERYSHVMHITSNVTGELAEGKDAFDALKACLPAGTVSGAPKVRAMQIIDALEPHRPRPSGSGSRCPGGPRRARAARGRAPR